MATPTFDQKSVDMGGLTLTYHDEGAGPALVFIHGMGGGSAAYGHQVAAFRDRFRAVAWDAPGYGGSDPFATDQPRVADYVDLIARFLDALGIDRAHLAGHSIGGCFVVSFARRFPARVASLSLLQAYPGRGIHAPADREAAYRERVAEIARLSTEEFARLRAVSAMAPGASEELIREVAALSYSNSAEGHLQQWAALCQANIYDEIEGVAAPAVLISGEYDKTANVDTARRIASHLPAAEVHVIPGVGHVAYQEAPNEMNRLMAEFLDS